MKVNGKLIVVATSLAGGLLLPHHLLAAPSAKEPTVEVTIDSPQNTVQKYLDTLLLFDGGEKSGKTKPKSGALLDAIKPYWDFAKLTRMSLGDNWDKISKQQQDEYAKLFMKLIEKSYIQRSLEIVQATPVKVGAEEIAGGLASVNVSSLEGGEKIDLAFQLHQRKEDWLIYNMVADATDLTRTFERQNSKLIFELGFDHVLERMRASN